MIRRLPRWGRALLLMSVVVVPGLGLIAWLRTTAREAWSSMSRRTREMVQEAQERSGARPVLTGAEEPGNAWTDYTQALEELEPVKGDLTQVAQFVTRHPAADPAAARRLIESKTRALEFLRRGARRAEGDYPYDWAREPGRRKTGIQLDQGLAYLAVGKARLQREAGKPRDAADTLLDVLQFGGDLRRNAAMIGDMIGASLCNLAIDELKDLVLSRQLTADELSGLARQLEIADRSWPDYTVSVRNESLVFRVALEGGDFKSVGMDRINALKAWRHGFSTRRMAADAVGRIEIYTEEAIRCESLAWKPRVAAIRKLRSVVLNATNFFVKNAAVGVSSYGTLERAALAKLRIVRAAAQVLAGGAFPELDDPYGGKIRRDGSRIWSVDRDGDDHLGKGSWKQEIPPQDLVLDLGRP